MNKSNKMLVVGLIVGAIAATMYQRSATTKPV